MKCTDLLTQDHKIILRGLDVLAQMARDAERHRPPEAIDVEALLRFFCSFADDHHQLKEESALFPELLRSYCGQEASLRHMLFEHDQERSLVAALEDALHTKQVADFVYFADRFVDLIRTHIHKEDRILFQIVEAALSPEQDAKVVAEFDKFEVDESLLGDLRMLEWKYLRKAA